MNTFSNRPGSEGRGRSRSNKGRKEQSSDSDNGKKGYKAKRSFSKNKSFRENKEASGGERKPFKSNPGKKPFSREKMEEKQRRAYGEREERSTDYGKDQYSERPRRAFNDEERPKRRPESREGNSERSRDKKPAKTFKSKDDKFKGFKKANSREGGFNPERQENNDRPEKKRRLTKPRKSQEESTARRVKYDEFEEGRAFEKQSYKEKEGGKPSKKQAQGSSDGLIRLNKYLSNAGIASRRDADNLILSGVVKVNGVVVDQLGSKIHPSDKVTYGDAAVKSERKVYLLLNKPKDYITTVDDPKERKTVMELVKGACKERIYPVGRLDRNTTGLLLFTNDGELTTKLTHPKHGIKKVYHVSLNKGLKAEDFKSIIEGVELEDGMIKADDLAFVGEGKKEVGIEIHSGRNRIVRRVFEHLGYDVIKLDRVVFAGLTKKDLPRGKHRFLTAKEISFLQMIG